jgi:drug/metabolite transporter (DMT)-like permease
LEVPLIWLLFFLSSVYGHVALKAAVGSEAERGALGRALASGWGWSAFVAWGLSCLLWTLALAHHRLLRANAVSSLRFVLIALTAWALLGERLTWTQGLGLLLIAAGILLVR